MTGTDAQRLAMLRAYGLMDTPPEARFDAIVDEAATALDTAGATITLVDDRRQWFKARTGMAATETPIADSICAHVVRDGHPLVVDDAAADPRFAAMNGIGGDGGVRFYAGVPLTLRDGVRVGTLCVLDPSPRGGIDAEGMATLERLARRTIAAFEASRDLAAMAALDPVPASDAVWIERAGSWLERAAAALDRVAASGPAAHLDQLIAMVERLRDAPVRDEGVRDEGVKGEEA